MTGARVQALDGIRGVAIALVIAGHSIRPAYETAGAAGVAVFFTLSGYLITTLLLTEHARTGRIDLRAFYVRRARRLLPALLVFLAVSLVVAQLTYSDFGTPSAAWPALLYAANFNRLYEFGDLGGLGPVMGFGHLWSLSIEEQFYLLFPLALVWLLRRGRRLLEVLVALTVLSAAVRVGLLLGGAGYERIYLGTDTNACLLLAGCALAVWRLRGGRLPGWTAPVAVAGLLPLGLWVGDFAVTWALVPLLASGLTVLAIAADRHPAWLGARPLTLLGRRSYALYLWHLPAVTAWEAFSGTLLGWMGWMGAAWVVTLLSWRYVEEPWLRRHRAAVALPYLRVLVREEGGEDVTRPDNDADHDADHRDEHRVLDG